MKHILKKPYYFLGGLLLLVSLSVSLFHASAASAATGTIVAQDTFQRTNQAHWGTATDGNVWTGEANTNVGFSINTTTGQVQTGGSSFNAILGGPLTDAEVLFTGKVSMFGGSNIGAVVRWADTNNLYKAYIDGSSLILQKRILGSSTNLNTASFIATAGTLYSLRFQVIGTTLQARVWPASSTEPSTWMVTATDATLSSGYSGLRILTQGSSVVNYTSFVSTNLSSGSTLTPTTTPAPTPTITPAPRTTTDYWLSGGSAPWGVMPDGSGNVWVAEPGCDPSPDCGSSVTPGKIGVYNVTAKTWKTTYQLPAGYGQPLFLAMDSSGNVWFPMFHTNTLGMLNPTTNTFQQWSVPTPNSGPWAITIDHNQKIWFTEHYVNQIAQFDPVTQTFKEIATPSTVSQPYGITVDAANSIWFTENNPSVALIAQYTQIGTLNEYKIRTTLPGGNLTPHQLAVDPSGNIWWTEGWVGMLGMLNVSQAMPGTTNGVAEYTYPRLCSSCSTHTSGISIDPTGTVWFDDSLQSAFGSFSNGVFSMNATPTTNSHPHDGILADASGNVFFTEEFANKLAVSTGTINLTPTPTIMPTPTVTPTITPTPTPTPGTIIAQDTFQRTNQAHWGTATDSNVWGGDANTQNFFSISNNIGQVANAGGSYNAVLGTSVANAQVFFTGSMNAYNNGNGNMGAVLRWMDTNNWYKAYIDGANLIVQKKIAGSAITLGSTSFIALPKTNYSMRFQVIGTNLQVKVWPTNSSEPSLWMITVSDSSLTSGFCGLRILTQTGYTASITSFTATSM